MSTAGWWVIALCAGLCSTLQSAINGNITKNLGAYAAMACNSVFFFLGTLFFLLYGIYQKDFSLRQWGELRWDQYTGGVFGFGVVLFLTLCFPRLGALTTMALMILGQSVVALLVDSQGLWGVPVVAITAQRLIAVALILGGVVLMNKF
jgi:transporter family-2 protein